MKGTRYRRSGLAGLNACLERVPSLAYDLRIVAHLTARRAWYAMHEPRSAAMRLSTSEGVVFACCPAVVTVMTWRCHPHVNLDRHTQAELLIVIRGRMAKVARRSELPIVGRMLNRERGQHADLLTVIRV